MSQYDADALSRIGRQSNPTNNPTTTTNRDEEKKLLHMWVHGLIILFIPLIILPLYLIFTSKTSEFWTCVINILSSAELVFISISLTIASTNDMVSFNGKKNRWIKINQLLLLFGAIIYGIMSIAQYSSEEYNTIAAIIFNLLFLAISIGLGIASYLKD